PTVRVPPSNWASAAREQICATIGSQLDCVRLVEQPASAIAASARDPKMFLFIELHSFLSVRDRAPVSTEAFIPRVCFTSPNWRNWTLVHRTKVQWIMVQ